GRSPCLPCWCAINIGVGLEGRHGDLPLRIFPTRALNAYVDIPRLPAACVPAIIVVIGVVGWRTICQPRPAADANMSQNRGVVLIYCPCGSEEEAVRIARELLDRRLIACANIHESRSLYFWKG